MATAQQSALEVAAQAMLAPADRPLKWGVQAQVDAVVCAVPARKVAVYSADMNGTPVFAGWSYEFGAAQAQRVAA